MSENPYKGVPGGDPRLRAEAFKALVSISYICSSCNQETSEKLPEGKDLTGRVCVDCRNAEGARKQKEQREEADRRWAEYNKRQRERPNRTEEEKLSLLEDWKDASKEQCHSCRGTFFIANPAMPFNNDDYNRANYILTVSYVNDPFEYEIYDKEKPNWYCRRCYREIELDI